MSGLADDLIRVINISSGGVSSYISSCMASCCLACKEDDYYEIDREGDDYQGNEYEKDVDAEWFRGLSKRRRCRLRQQYEKQNEKY